MKLQFELNPNKALEATLYILSKRASVNLYNLLKICFEADKVHLNQHGRPVTGDSYKKMIYGTVPAEIFNMLKGDPLMLNALGLERLPLRMEGYHVTATRAPNLDYLSESDVEALDAGIAKYLDLSFNEVKALNHRERCWQASELNDTIDFALMIEDESLMDDLSNTPFQQVI